MNFVTIDYVFGIIILTFGIIALSKGFVDELFGKAAFVLGLISGYFFYNTVAEIYLGKINSQIACNILAFISVFVGTFLVVKLVGLIVSKLFQFSILNSLNRCLGFIFGLLEGFAVVCLIIFIMQNQQFVDLSNLFVDSFFYNHFVVIIKSPEFRSVTHNV